MNIFDNDNVVVIVINCQINDLTLDTLLRGFLGFTLSISARCTGFLVSCSLFSSLQLTLISMSDRTGITEYRTLAAISLGVRPRVLPEPPSRPPEPKTRAVFRRFSAASMAF